MKKLFPYIKRFTEKWSIPWHLKCVLAHANTAAEHPFKFKTETIIELSILQGVFVQIWWWQIWSHIEVSPDL